MRTFNDETGRERRGGLRSQLPPAEAMLWKHLARGGAGAKFRRQHGIGIFVVDFYCPEVRLAVELDGLSHEGDDAAEKDARRQSEIEELGVIFLRFENRAVYRNIAGVVQTIADEVERLRAIGHTRKNIVEAAARGENVRNWPGLGREE